MDIDNTGPFTPFQLPPAPPVHGASGEAPQPVAPPAPPEQKKKRGGRPKKTADAAKPGKPGRPPKAAAAPAAPQPNGGRAHAPRPVMVDLATAFAVAAELTEDDRKFVWSAVHAMQAFTPAQRRRIVAALGKMFPAE